MPRGGLSHFKPVGNFLHRLIAVVRLHMLPRLMLKNTDFCL